MAGPTGLDYAGVRCELEVGHGLRGKALRDAWAGIKAAEHATLSVWDERRRAREARQKAKGPPR